MLVNCSALIYFLRNLLKYPPSPPCDAPLSTNRPPKRIKILKQKRSTPTTDTWLSDLNVLFSLYAYRAVAWRGAGRGGLIPLTVFCLKKSKHAQIKSWNYTVISQSINETMTSLQLGVTFSGFKLQRPWVLQTQNPLLCFVLFFVALNCWALAYDSFFLNKIWQKNIPIYGP